MISLYFVKLIHLYSEEFYCAIDVPWYENWSTWVWVKPCSSQQNHLLDVDPLNDGPMRNHHIIVGCIQSCAIISWFLHTWVWLIIMFPVEMAAACLLFWDTPIYDHICIYIYTTIHATSIISYLTDPNRWKMGQISHFSNKKRIHSRWWVPSPNHQRVPWLLQLDDVRHAAIGLAEDHVFSCDATKGHLRPWASRRWRMAGFNGSYEWLYNHGYIMKVTSI